MIKLKIHVGILFLVGSLIFSSCRNDDEEIISSVITQVAPSDSVSGPIKGFFLLNEGNMGSNKATLDYFDYTTGK